MVRAPVFQTGDEGSIPFTRSLFLNNSKSFPRDISYMSVEFTQNAETGQGIVTCGDKKITFGSKMDFCSPTVTVLSFLFHHIQTFFSLSEIANSTELKSSAVKSAIKLIEIRLQNRNFSREIELRRTKEDKIAKVGIFRKNI